MAATAPDTVDEGKGYDMAIDMLRQCAQPTGFVASPIPRTNYHRVWARDGAIISLAALLTGDGELIEASRHTLETLATHQGPNGEIPSNVDIEARRVSYGGTAGRVDADLWFIIAIGEYWRATDDDELLETLLPAIEGVRFLLGAWEFNNRGLIYVPLTGDWADEYLQHGYVLYDQALYLQALRTLCAIHAHLHDSEDHALMAKAARLRHLIRSNYWFDDGGDPDPDIYHPTLVAKGHDAAPNRDGKYWMPYFVPTGYGYRFDAFANVLVSLLDIANDEQRRAVDEHIAERLPEELPLVPAFSPVITPIDGAWNELQMTFRYSFRNRPHEYQNGGLWPMISGFYVADLAARAKDTEAARVLDAIHRANALPSGEDDEWSFPEYVHGEKLTAGETTHQGWSAAGAVIAHHAVDGDRVFRITGASPTI